MVSNAYTKVRHHEDLFRLVVEHLRDHAIFTIDRDGRIATWNEGARRVLGYEEAEIVGQPASIIFTPEDRRIGQHDLEMRTALERGVATDERWHLRKDGTRFWGHGLMHELRDGETIGFVKIVRDETRRKRAEDDLRELNQALESRVAERTHRIRRLARELSQAEDRERQRLAERLHDHLQQLIIASKLKLNPLMNQPNPADARTAVEEADQLLDEAVSESRALTRELSPPSIPQGGLAEAFQQLAEWMQQTHGLRVQLDLHEGTEPAPEDLRGFLHRAGRELLINTAKHAGVEEAKLSLQRTDHHVRLTVEDEGSGFDPDASPEHASTPGSGFGLHSLHERCELLGGDLRIDSAPGRGTRITITLPLNGR